MLKLLIFFVEQCPSEKYARSFLKHLSCEIGLFLIFCKENFATSNLSKLYFNVFKLFQTIALPISVSSCVLLSTMQKIFVPLAIKNRSLTIILGRSFNYTEKTTKLFSSVPPLVTGRKSDFSRDISLATACQSNIWFHHGGSDKSEEH